MKFLILKCKKIAKKILTTSRVVVRKALNKTSKHRKNKKKEQDLKILILNSLNYIRHKVSIFTTFVKKIKSPIPRVASSIKSFAYLIYIKINKAAQILKKIFLNLITFVICRLYLIRTLHLKCKKFTETLYSPAVKKTSFLFRTLFSSVKYKKTTKTLKENALLISGVISCGILSALLLAIDYKKDTPLLSTEMSHQEDNLGMQAVDAGEKALTAVLGITGDTVSMLSEVIVDSSEAAEISESINIPVDETPPVLTSIEQTPINNDSVAVEIEIVQYNVIEIELISHLQIGGDYTYVRIKPEDSSSFEGSLGGLQASYEYRPNNSFYGAGNFSWKEGTTSGSSGTRSLIYIDAQERLGYTASFNDTSCLLTLFSGLGYRHFWQKLTTNSNSSLQFKYDEFYIPIGIATDYTVNSWLAFGLGFTWMPQVYSTTAITALKGTRWSLTNTLPNFFIETPINFTLTKNKRFHLVLNPFYEHWEDGHSTAATAAGIPLGLPGNTYNFWGVNLNFLYQF